MENLKCLNQEAILLLKKHNCLKDLIRSMLVEKVIDSIKFSKEEYKKVEEDLKKTHGLGQEIALQDWLAENEIPVIEYLNKFIFPYKVKRYSLAKFKNKTEAKFLSKKDDLDTIVYSLIRVQDLYLAKELYQRINEGEAEFSDVAAKYSEGAERNTNGIVGPIPLSVAAGELQELLKSSLPGQLRQPIKFKQWYLIVRLENITHAKLDEDMIEKLSQQLFYEWINSEAEKQVEKLCERFQTKENILV